MFLAFDKIEHETDNATLFLLGDEKQWIPKSVHEEPNEEEGVVEVPRWFVEEEGLELYTI